MHQLHKRPTTIHDVGDGGKALAQIGKPMQEAFDDLNMVLSLSSQENGKEKALAYIGACSERDTDRFKMPQNTTPHQYESACADMCQTCLNEWNGSEGS